VIVPSARRHSTIRLNPARTPLTDPSVNSDIEATRHFMEVFSEKRLIYQKVARFAKSSSADFAE
jgi:hypothetical protein